MDMECAGLVLAQITPLATLVSFFLVSDIGPAVILIFIFATNMEVDGDIRGRTGIRTLSGLHTRGTGGRRVEGLYGVAGHLSTLHDATLSLARGVPRQRKRINPCIIVHVDSIYSIWK